MLGEETHNRGQVPLLVELKSGKKIVYKPRSMRAEELVCGHQDSLFIRLDQDCFTYRIYDKETHGYSEYLENIEEENRFETAEEIHQFLSRYCTLEKYARALGLADLHQENLLVSKKAPLIIDGEVVVPKEAPVFETGLLSGLTAGYLFTSETKNRIWFGEEPLSQLDKSDVERIRQNDFGAIDTLTFLSNLEVMSSLEYKEDGLTQKEIEEIDKTSELLASQKHRIVIINTADLKECIKDPLDRSQETFMEQLEEGARGWGFALDMSKREQILECFCKDVKNNDIPIFYFQRITNRLYYQGILIGKRDLQTEQIAFLRP